MEKKSKITETERGEKGESTQSTQAWHTALD